MTRPPARQQSARPQAGQKRPQATPKPGGKEAAPARDRVLRLFFGLALPDEVAAELTAAQAKLSSNWRRVEAGQLHVTLAYVPGVPESRVAQVQALGERLAREAAPITLKLRGTGYHPNVGTPRVWFVKVEGEGLSELAAHFTAELETLGFPAEGKFQPHVTLARKKGPAPRLPPLNFAQEWQAGQIHLIHTFLPRDKTGPVYDTVSRFRLTGSAPLKAPEGASVPTPLPTTPASEE